MSDLIYKSTNVIEKLDDAQISQMEALCDEYRVFLDEGKTERECVDFTVLAAKEKGYKDISEYDSLKPGDKVYMVNRKKNVLLAVIGKEPMTDGFNLVGSHIDSPRLDLKQNPLYESCNMSLLRTHYYGGIKKYQWTAIPLAIHGVVFTKDGEEIKIKIGEDENDPVFCINDLLPHLGKDQMSKKLSEGIEGEALTVLVGGWPVLDEDADNKIKLNVLNILNKKYKITERDFLSAEIEVVPAFKAKNIGFDGAFVGGYGQDDRVCAFTSLKAIFEVENPEKTALCIMVDKEEIGSMGNTGMQSDFFKLAVAELIAKEQGNCDYLAFCKALSNSSCLSSDVAAAVDPNYESVNEKQNAAICGYGVCMVKFTGARGKSSASDANAEFVYKIGKAMDDNDVYWQTSEMGKVDHGGGGTIAQYVANLNMDVLDCGTPVLSMHSPYEVTAKTDVYMTYKAYKAFYDMK